MLNRRDFIKAIAAALAATVVPTAQSKTLTLKKAVEVAAASEATGVIGVDFGFDPRMAYGLAVHISDRTEVGVHKAKEMLIASARKHLPRGTKFYVLDGGEAKVYGAGGAINDIDSLAWLYSPTPLQPPRVNQVIAEVTA